MKLTSHIIIIKCIIFVFSDTLKIYDKKSSMVRIAYWWEIYMVIFSDVNCNWWQRWASGSGLHRGARLQPWELEVPAEIISDYIIVQDLIWSIEKKICKQCNAAMIMPGMHRVCPQPLLVSRAPCWTGFSTSLAAGRCKEDLSTPFFFPCFDNKTTDGKSVLFSVCVMVSSSAEKSMTTSFTMCLLLFLYAGTPPRVLDKKKQNINKVLTMDNRLTGTWTNRRDTCLGCSCRSLDLGWKLGNSEVWRLRQICHHSNMTNIHRLVWNLQVKSKKK